jgi:hypothetical protein
MVAWLVLIGGLLVPSGVFLLWGWRASRNEMALMRATETTRAADVAKLPEGSVVEVKGRLRCAAPLTAELSNSPCAHYAASIEREYEVLEYDASRKTSCLKRKTELVRWNTVSAPFEIEDESGRATVLPENAIIEGITAIDRYDAHHEQMAREDALQAAVKPGTSNHRTLGFRYKEMHLPIDVEIYVLGVAGKDNSIGTPPDGAKGQRFIISISSEEARTAELGTKSRWMLSLGAFCLIGAAVCLSSALYVARHGLNRAAPPQEVLQSEGWW